MALAVGRISVPFLVGKSGIQKGPYNMIFAKIGTLVILMIAGLSTAALADPNGHTTNLVRFDGGSFERSHSGEWLEFATGNNEPRFRWRVTNRDEWSIYLRDDSRAMNMQIDMYRDRIGLEWEGHPMQDQYLIIESDDRVNGRLVTQVRFSEGYFRVGRNGQWREINADGVTTNRFRETGRDAWSVYLRDDSREMDMQIDVHRNWIRLAWPGHPMADQYPITWSQ